jgi:hypothetical protein
LIRDSLACQPVVFEGDCHKPESRRDCPPGYEFEGTWGCRMVEPYAWRNRDAGIPDAGPPEAGTPDSAAPEAGPAEAGLPDAGVQDGGR